MAVLSVLEVLVERVVYAPEERRAERLAPPLRVNVVV